MSSSYLKFVPLGDLRGIGEAKRRNDFSSSADEFFGDS
jgi:hypothetical protein